MQKSFQFIKYSFYNFTKMKKMHCKPKPYKAYETIEPTTQRIIQRIILSDFWFMLHKPLVFQFQSQLHYNTESHREDEKREKEKKSCG